MKDLLMTDDGDLDVSELGLHLVDGAQRVAQQVRTRLRTFLGEWEFDLDAGVPWYQRIIGIKAVSLNDVDAVLKAQILDVADVEAILEFSMTFNSSARSLAIRSKISTTFGAVQVEGNFP